MTTIDCATALAVPAMAFEAARAAAESVAVTVLDARGLVLCQARMDAAMPAAGSASLAKARTAWLHLSPSEELAGFGDGIARGAAEPISTFAGGLPLLAEGELVGAVGVAGASEQTDGRIARLIRDAVDRQTIPSAADAP